MKTTWFPNWRQMSSVRKGQAIGAAVGAVGAFALPQIAILVLRSPNPPENQAYQFFGMLLLWYMYIFAASVEQLGVAGAFATFIVIDGVCGVVVGTIVGWLLRVARYRRGAHLGADL